MDYLSRYPKSALFVASERTAERVAVKVSNRVFSLESVFDFDGERIRVNLESVKQSLIDNRVFSKAAEKERRPRRSSRLEATAKIKDELISHLIDARDHAVSTRYSEGEAKLLDRPTQKDIAKLTGLTTTSVNRCFTDPANHEIRHIYEVLDDVEKIVTYSGSLRRDGITAAD
ncbi:hypothetical protein [Rubinisphaera margarita]|uniref:hypothetical protein n=1 Tax=Rubinisphaera margarita TaxID=2909586 RepID=UPI001EE87101|nr:hypothetical protein [Rubinisphaera margarita]MCG6158329.1 hypothetical protein [Rubinisphaera margarita]